MQRFVFPHLLFWFAATGLRRKVDRERRGCGLFRHSLGLDKAALRGAAQGRLPEGALELRRPGAGVEGDAQTGRQ